MSRSRSCSPIRANISRRSRPPARARTDPSTWIPIPSCRPAPGRLRCGRSARGCSPSTRCSMRTPASATRSARSARAAITPRRTARWASACSATSRSPACTRAPGAGRAHRRHRFRRAPRQRHAGHLLVGEGPVLRLHAPDAALGTGAVGEAGVGNIWNAPLRPATAASRSARRSIAHPSRFAELRTRPRPDLGRVRRARGRSARQPAPRRGGFHVGDGEAGRSRPLHWAHRIVSMLEGGYDLTALARSVGVPRQDAHGRAREASQAIGGVIHHEHGRPRTPTSRT